MSVSARSDLCSCLLLNIANHLASSCIKAKKIIFVSSNMVFRIICGSFVTNNAYRFAFCTSCRLHNYKCGSLTTAVFVSFNLVYLIVVIQVNSMLTFFFFSTLQNKRSNSMMDGFLDG